MIYILLFIFTLAIFTIVYGQWVYSARPKEQLSMSIVMGSGGHTMEMIQLLKGLQIAIFSKRTYFVTSGDQLSKEKVKQLELDEYNHEFDESSIITIPRSRAVGQSWITVPFSVLKTLCFTGHYLLRNVPDVMISNGPGTSVPLFYLLKLFKLFNLCSTELIYVESIARVEALSLSGKLIYPISDLFLVQWPQLVDKYPRAKYNGILV